MGQTFCRKELQGAESKEGFLLNAIKITRSDMITETANARILPSTLAKIHEIKSLLGFKTLLEAAEYVVSEIHNSPAVLEAKNASALITRNQEHIARIQASASRK